MTVKERAVRIISRLPEDATLQEIVAELYVRLKVRTGLEQLDQGKGILHARVKKRMGKWLG